MRIMLEVLAILLMPQERMLIHSIVDAVNCAALPKLLGPVLAVSRIALIKDVLGAMVAFLLALLSFKLAIFVSALEGGQGLLTEAALVAVEVEVRSFVAFFVVVFFGSTGFVFVIGALKAFDNVTLLVTLLYFLLEGIFA